MERIGESKRELKKDRGFDKKKIFFLREYNSGDAESKVFVLTKLFNAKSNAERKRMIGIKKREINKERETEENRDC